MHDPVISTSSDLSMFADRSEVGVEIKGSVDVGVIGFVIQVNEVELQLCEASDKSELATGPEQPSTK